jgi:tetratricopeptide (TPR) repeat protein
MRRRAARSTTSARLGGTDQRRTVRRPCDSVSSTLRVAVTFDTPADLARQAIDAAAQLESERAGAARRRLERLRPALETAWHQHARGSSRFGLAVGLDACLEQGREREQHLDVLDATADELSDPVESAYLRYRAARVEFLRGYWESAVERLRAMTRSGMPPDFSADARLVESAALRYLGEPEYALRLIDQALTSTTSKVVEMRAHFHRAGALLMLDRLDQVEAHARRALALTLRLRASRQRALVLTLLSWHALAMGRPGLATEYAAEARVRFGRLHDRLMAAKAVTFLAWSRLEGGDASGRRTLSRARTLATAAGDRGMITRAALLDADHLGKNARVRLRECLWDNEAVGANALALRVRTTLEHWDLEERDHLALRAHQARLMEGGALHSIDLSRHDKPRRVLRRLAEARIAGEGPITVEALLVAAWPGERLIGTSGQNRVYAAIRFLRRAGLQSVIRSCSAGYELTCPVRLQA